LHGSDPLELAFALAFESGNSGPCLLDRGRQTCALVVEIPPDHPVVTDRQTSDVSSLGLPP
jgi:hypothetical protein